MGSTNFTTHYEIPLPLGSDKTTPMDYNESMQAVDTALFEAQGNASSAIAGLEITNGNVAQNASDIDALEGRMTTAEGTIVTQGNAINNLTLDVTDVRADGQDMITAYKEPTAQSTHAYSVGDYFIYNDVLYKATDSIAVGDTIVPDTNCKTTNVTTELKKINSDLSGQHVMYEQRRHSFGFVNPTDLADALHQTAEHILAYIQGLADDVSVEILNMKFIGAGNIIMPSDSATLYDNSATDFSIHCSVNNTSGTTMYLYDLICWAGTASANRISRAAIANVANPTFANLALSDLTGLTGFNFDIRVWKKL